MRDFLPKFLRGNKNSVQTTHPFHPTTPTPTAVADAQGGTQSSQNIVQPGDSSDLRTHTLPPVSYFANAQGGTFIYPNFSTIGGNQINNIYSNPHWVLQTLSQAIAGAGASHDSAARYPLIGCHPNTREEILEALLEWARDPLESPFYWLYGPAGHGKSTIAQTLAQTCAKDGHLVASYFFSRHDAKRNTPTYLFPTIAYGLASRIPSLLKTIGEVIQANPAIFESSLDTQFQELIVKPCRSFTELWDSAWPRLVIIDGLDECQDGVMQKHILSILSSPYNEMESFPLHFLICSRPEPTVRETFDSFILYHHSQRTPLNNSWKACRDIKRYLADRLNALRCEPRYSAIRFPDPWPPHGTVDQLADESDGQFVYVSTAVAFVGDSEFHDPCRRLDVILRLIPKGENESPFAPLDVLYRHVLSANPNQKRLVLILGLILHPPNFVKYTSITRPRLIEILLDLPEGQLNLELRAMHSVLDITGSYIRILHASFTDFLRDKTRSGDFYIDPTYFESFNVSCALQYLNRCLQDASRNPREFMSFDSNSLVSILWHCWVETCKHIKLHTQELVSVLEDLDLDTMYGVVICGVIDDPECDCVRYWRGLVDRIREASTWLQAQNSMYHRVALKFSAARKGFHISLLAPSALSPVLRLLGARSEISRISVSGYNTGYITRRDILQFIVNQNQQQIGVYMEGQAQTFHVTQCQNCTSAQTRALVPTECSPGVFYVRTCHPNTALIISLLELIPSDFTSEVILTLLGPNEYDAGSLLPKVGALLPLLPLFPRILPHILDGGEDLDVEQTVWNLLRWLKTFPEESKRQMPFTDLIRLIRDWVLRTETGDRDNRAHSLYCKIQDYIADPHSFPQS